MTTPALAAALMIPSVADRFVFVNAVVAVAGKSKTNMTSLRLLFGDSFHDL